MKKLLATMFGVALSLAVFPVAALADEPNPEPNLITIVGDPGSVDPSLWNACLVAAQKQANRTRQITWCECPSTYVCHIVPTLTQSVAANQETSFRKLSRNRN